MNDPVFWQAFLVPFLLFIGLVALLLHQRCRARLPTDVLEYWVQREGHPVIRLQFRPLFHGPFSWTKRKGRAVFHVTLEDELGRERSAWVRCSMQIDGSPLDPIEVVWVD